MRKPIHESIASRGGTRAVDQGDQPDRPRIGKLLKSQKLEPMGHVHNPGLAPVERDAELFENLCRPSQNMFGTRLFVRALIWSL
jgi:hypothetical protein